MRSKLRSEQHRKRERDRIAEPEAHDECPVCFMPYTRGLRTERARSVFPCGHAVCRACDANMMRRNFHSCPTCRTPREGFSQEEVDLAAHARAVQDAETDDPGTTVMFAVQVYGDQRAPSAPSAPPSAPLTGSMFFRNESTGDPFTALRLTGAAAARGVLTLRRSQRGAERVEDEEDETSDATEGRPILDQALHEFIRTQLLQPSDLHTFLARHRELFGHRM